MTTTEIIEKEFNGFLKNTYPELEQMPFDQRIQLYRAFLAGSMVNNSLYMAIAKDTTENLLAAMQKSYQS